MNNRLMIAGTGSGCGKTTVTAALLQALVTRGLCVNSFKCGPDYIDPMFHAQITGTPCRNLDLYFCEPETLCGILLEQEADLAVIEGVMGYYDGITGAQDKASSCEVSCVTQTPTILTVRPQGIGFSLVAQISGFLNFRPNMIAGFILNGVSGQGYSYYKEMIESELGIPVCGYLPKDAAFIMPSRHLGLVPVVEQKSLLDILHALGKQAEQTLDIDELLKIAGNANALSNFVSPYPAFCAPCVRIGIAQDEAFHFYYEDNLQILRALGAELVPFSPVSDDALPCGLDGLYLGGGYPELFAEQISSHKNLLLELKNAIVSGVPTIAECGGFLLLHDTLNEHQMAGVIRADAVLGDRLQHFGYIEMTANKECLLCKEGETLRAHEFHYAISTREGDGFIASKPGRVLKRNCAFTSETLYAGYPHFHFAGATAIAQRFITACKRKELNP